MAPHPNRKASDEDIIMLNNMGLSVTGIARMFNMHPTSVSARLKRLNIPVVNPRHAFMDGLLQSLSEPELAWLSSKVSQKVPIQMFIRDLITAQYKKEMSSNGNSQPNP